MKISYKIDGNFVERNTFNSLVKNMHLFNTWERIVQENKAKIEKEQVAINYKLVNGKMQVITDTQLLFQLNYQVNKELLHTLQLQPVLAYL